MSGLQSCGNYFYLLHWRSTWEGAQFAIKAKLTQVFWVENYQIILQLGDNPKQKIWANSSGFEAEKKTKMLLSLCQQEELAEIVVF